MTKVIFGLLMASVLLYKCCTCRSAAGWKIFRIGFLDPSNASTSAVRLEAFWQEIRKLGCDRRYKHCHRVAVCRGKTVTDYGS